MAVERVSGSSSLIDVLDRILDKSIVIDAWVRISLVGIDLMTVEDQVVVAAMDTCLTYDGSPGRGGPPAKQVLSEATPQNRIRQVAPRPVRQRG